MGVWLILLVLVVFLILNFWFVYAFEASIYFTWNLNDANDGMKRVSSREDTGLVSCNSSSEIGKIQEAVLKTREGETPCSRRPRSFAFKTSISMHLLLSTAQTMTSTSTSDQLNIPRLGWRPDSDATPPRLEG